MTIGNLADNPNRQNSNPELTQNQAPNAQFGTGQQTPYDIPNVTRKVQYAAEGNDPFSQLTSAGDTLIHNAGQDYGSGEVRPDNYDIVDAIYDTSKLPGQLYNARNDENNRIRQNTRNENLSQSFLNNLGPNINQFGDNVVNRYTSMRNLHQEDDDSNTSAMNIANLSTKDAMDSYNQLLSLARNNPNRKISSLTMNQMRQLHNELARRGINTSVFNHNAALNNEERQSLIDNEYNEHKNRNHLFHENAADFHQRTRLFDFPADHPVAVEGAPLPEPQHQPPGAPPPNHLGYLDRAKLINNTTDQIANMSPNSHLHANLAYLQEQADNETLPEATRNAAADRLNALMGHAGYQTRLNRLNTFNDVMARADTSTVPDEAIPQVMQHLYEITADNRYSRAERQAALDKMRELEPRHDAILAPAGAPPPPPPGPAAAPPGAPPPPPARGAGAPGVGARIGNLFRRLRRPARAGHGPFPTTWGHDDAAALFARPGPPAPPGPAAAPPRYLGAGYDPGGYDPGGYGRMTHPDPVPPPAADPRGLFDFSPDTSESSDERPGFFSRVGAGIRGIPRAVRHWQRRRNDEDSDTPSPATQAELDRQERNRRAAQGPGFFGRQAHRFRQWRRGRPADDTSSDTSLSSSDRTVLHRRLISTSDDEPFVPHRVPPIDVGHDYSGYSTDELNRQIEASIYAMNHFSDRDDIFPQEYSHLSSISDVLNILREQMAERDRRRGI